MKQDRKATSKEYDAFYKSKPNKWSSDERNGLAKETIEMMLGRDPFFVLDIGCGIGHTIKYLMNFWKTTKFFGIDPSPVGIDICRSKLPQARFEAGFLGDKFTGLGKFDAIIMLGVLEHIPDTDAALQALHPIMKENGIVYIEVPNCIAYNSMTNKAEGLRRIEQGNKQYEWHRFRETWEALFIKNGFSISLSKVGPRQEYEFLWVLEKQK